MKKGELYVKKRGSFFFDNMTGFTDLMHYRTEKSGYECLADLNEVAKTFPELQQLTTSEMEVGSIQGVVTLKAANEN